MKNKKYDIGLVILGSMVAFFISLAATAFYDLFKDLALEAYPSEIKGFQVIFIVGPLACAIYIFREILKDFVD